MNNIHDWCISRQLWWGHRIPAWYCEACGEMIVAARDADELSQMWRPHFRQESDVLDTWFSSRFGRSRRSAGRRRRRGLRYYPTSVLVTGFDIIFFWVARMMMMGVKFIGDVPFRTVYINGLVRDEHGQKMASRGGT